MVAKAKQPDKPPIQMTVDDKWLAEYTEKVKAFGGTIEEYEKEATTDQADLSDVVEKQEEQVKKTASSPLPKTKDQIKQDKELNAALQRGKQQAKNEQALHRRAQKMDAASAEREAKEKAREQEVQRKEAEEEEDEQRAKSIRDVRHVTQGINRALQNNVQPAIERAGTLPTVGGIGLMVGILLVLLILIIPVNEAGDTRAKQFWYMLNGRAKLQGAVSPVTGSQVAGVTSIDTTGGVPIKPDGSCPPGYHGAMANGQLFCQPDNKSITTTPNSTTLPSTSGLNGSTFRSTPGNLGF